MSYTYLLEQGEEYSAASFSDIPPSVLSKLNLTAERSYSKDNETASCQSSQSGTMFAPSTGSLGAEKSISSAGDSLAKTSQAQGGGAGIEEGTRSGLWYQMARIISEIRPRFIFIENSPLLRKRGLNKVLRSLAEMGYDARWGVLGARDVGGPHRRDRCWILASYTNCDRLQKNTNEDELCGKTTNDWSPGRFSKMGGETIWPSPRPIGAIAMGVGNGMAGSVDRLKACGNGQVPLVAATAFRILSD
jgi:hypothetical protein